MFMEFFLVHNTEAYHINIISEEYLCIASASAGVNNSSNTGTYASGASEMDVKFIGQDLYEASASGTVMITPYHSINSFGFYSVLILDAKGSDPVGGASASATATGTLTFQVLMDPHDINPIPQVNIESVSTMWAVSGPYVNYLFGNLNGSDLPEGVYTVPLAVNNLNILTLNFSNMVASQNDFQYVNMEGSFFLQLPYTYAPLPSSVLFLGSGLTIVATLGYKKKRAKDYS
jgi:hypothetical protein